MTLRDTSPQRLKELIEQVEEEWANTTPEERVQETWNAFVKVYVSLANVAWGIEASQGHLNNPKRVQPPPLDSTTTAQVRDLIASQALSNSEEIGDLIDKLEAQQQIIATENFGDQATSTGRSSDTLVVLINCLRPMAEVIQDAAADAKSGTMTTLQTIQSPNSTPEA